MDLGPFLTIFQRVNHFEKSSKMAQNWGKGGKINMLNLRSIHFSVRFPKPKMVNRCINRLADILPFWL